MGSPKISVIVPVYNAESTIRRCVDSILAQTFTDFECLLIDDGSKDQSGEICDEYAEKDRRIRVFHKENGGVSSARNMGLDNAKGEWITFVDSDDWIEPDMVEKLVKPTNQKDVDIVIGDFQMVSGDSIKEHRSIDWTSDKTESLNRYIASVWTIACGNIVKRSLYERHSVTSQIGITYCEDFHLMVRLCFFADRIVHVNIPLYNYRQRASSVMHNLNKRTELDEQWAYQDIIRFFKEQNVYPDFKKVMNWRVLKSAQELLLDPAGLDRFQELYKDGENDMWSCPFVNTKIKILAWLMTHHLRSVVVTIDRFRMLIGR